MANPAAPAELPQYDAIRRRLQNQYGQRKQEQTDAIQRRFAANGMVGSGAFGKAQDEAAAAVGREEADATAQLDFAEANELQRQKEVAEGRQFQTSERMGAQQFASGERQGSQQFQTGERTAAQDFNLGMFNQDLAFKKEQFGEQKSQFQQEYAANVAGNRASVWASLVGDNVDDYDTTQRANAWLDRIFPKPGAGTRY